MSIPNDTPKVDPWKKWQEDKFLEAVAHAGTPPSDDNRISALGKQYAALANTLTAYERSPPYDQEAMRHLVAERIYNCIAGKSKILDLSGLDLPELPDLSNYTDLLPEILDINLGNNHLEKIPPWIQDFKNLQYLNLSNNNITVLSDPPNLPALHTLDLSGNPIEWLGLVCWPSLQKLVLAHAGTVRLLDDIHKHPKLSIVDIFNTKIQKNILENEIDRLRSSGWVYRDDFLVRQNQLPPKIAESFVKQIMAAEEPIFPIPLEGLSIEQQHQLKRAFFGLVVQTLLKKLQSPIEVEGNGLEQPIAAERINPVIRDGAEADDYWTIHSLGVLISWGSSQENPRLDISGLFDPKIFEAIHSKLQGASTEEILAQLPEVIQKTDSSDENRLLMLSALMAGMESGNINHMKQLGESDTKIEIVEKYPGAQPHEHYVNADVQGTNTARGVIDISSLTAAIKHPQIDALNKVWNHHVERKNMLSEKITWLKNWLSNTAVAGIIQPSATEHTARLRCFLLKTVGKGHIDNNDNINCWFWRGKMASVDPISKTLFLPLDAQTEEEFHKAMNHLIASEKLAYIAVPLTPQIDAE